MITDFLDTNPNDNEPYFVLHVTFEDQEELLLRITRYNISFNEGTFVLNNRDIHYHDNLSLEFPATDKYDITALFSHFHIHGAITGIMITGKTQDKIFYANDNNYWNRVYDLQSIPGEEEVIRNYELVLCHEVS